VEAEEPKGRRRMRRRRRRRSGPVQRKARKPQMFFCFQRVCPILAPHRMMWGIISQRRRTSITVSSPGRLNTG